MNTVSATDAVLRSETPCRKPHVNEDSFEAKAAYADQDVGFCQTSAWKVNSAGETSPFWQGHAFGIAGWVRRASRSSDQLVKP